MDGLGRVSDSIHTGGIFSSHSEPPHRFAAFGTPESHRNGADGHAPREESNSPCSGGTVRNALPDSNTKEHAAGVKSSLHRDGLLHTDMRYRPGGRSNRR